MLTLQQVRKLLEDRSVSLVAKATGIKASALYHMRKKSSSRVMAKDWERLSDYFTKQMREAGFVPAETPIKTDPNA